MNDPAPPRETAAKPTPVHGVLVFDKPIGPTSHDIVSHVRRALRQRDIGHAGTLDPMATGVLVLAVGEATKLVPYLTGHSKTYETIVQLGRETDSLDATGRTTREMAIDDTLRAELVVAANSGGVSAGTVGRALAAELSRTSQVPPLVSAIHVDGERAYELARRGEERTLPAREVGVRRIELLGVDPERGALQVRLHVDKGYFVRAFARDLAASLGTVGHLTELRRIQSGPFTLEPNRTVDRTMSGADLRGKILPLAEAAGTILPRAVLTSVGLAAARAGRRVAPENIAWASAEASVSPGAETEVYAWMSEDGILVAVGRKEEDGSGKVARGFTAASSSRGDELQ